MKPAILLAKCTLLFSLPLSSAIISTCKKAETSTYCDLTGSGDNLSETLLSLIEKHGPNLTLHIAQGTYRLNPLMIAPKKKQQLSNITIALDKNVILKAPPENDPLWKSAKKEKNIITLKNVEKFVLKGEGPDTSVIHGNGETWWFRKGAKKGQRPSLIRLESANHVTIEGLHIKSHPSFGINASESDDLSIKNVKVTADPKASNTDGISLTSTERVTIQGCNVSNGDDEITIKSKKGKPSSDIHIEDCTLSDGHGLAIGSRVLAPITNISGKSIRIVNTTIGLRIKVACHEDCEETKNAPISNISFANVTLTNIKWPILVDLEYARKTTDSHDMPSFAHTSLGPISFSNIVATHSKKPASIICEKKNNCTFSFANVVIDKGTVCRFVNGKESEQPCF